MEPWLQLGDSGVLTCYHRPSAHYCPLRGRGNHRDISDTACPGAAPVAVLLPHPLLLRAVPMGAIQLILCHSAPS